MADLGSTFDASQADTSRDLLPPGEYLVQIVKSEMKPTAKHGQQLVLEMAIMDGQYTGRHVWDRLNLMCPHSPVAQDIAHKTLNNICAATNSVGVTDSEQLHHKSMIARVVVKPGEGEYGPKNDVKSYAAAGGARVVGIHSTVQPDTARSTFNGGAAPTQAPAASVPPWRRSASA